MLLHTFWMNHTRKKTKTKTLKPVIIIMIFSFSNGLQSSKFRTSKNVCHLLHSKSVAGKKYTLSISSAVIHRKYECVLSNTGSDDMFTGTSIILQREL